MTKHFIYKALENMDRFGSSFEQALAFCYSQADPDNQTILYNSFEHPPIVTGKLLPNLSIFSKAL